METTMSDKLTVFERIGTSSGAESRYVNLMLRLGKPSQLLYEVQGFLEEKQHLNPEVFAKKVELLLGVDSNFSYELYGQIESPTEFKGIRCQLMVNPQAGSDYIECASRGHIGDGFCTNTEFYFRLYVAPDIAKNILERRLLAEKVEERFAEELSLDIERNGSPAWMRVRVDAVNYRHIEFDDKVWFDLVRLYCY